MEIGGRTIALYGRFSPGARERLKTEVERLGGQVLRDLTGRSDVFVVGALAVPLIDAGALASRLGAARERSVPVMGERAFAAALSREASEPATLPLASALGPAGLSRDAADVLAAFDLVVIEADRCRFADAQVIRTAAELLGQGRSLGEVVRILAETRDRSPRGRRRIVLTPAGEAALAWENGDLTNLRGQAYLPLHEDHPTLDDLFEAAQVAEAGGRADEAARLYDQCARADRTDAVAPYNLGNIRLGQGRWAEAVLAYQRALARDGRFAEARYNLAQALEAAGKPQDAIRELERLLQSQPDHGDALFNLAQLRMKAADLVGARPLYERYLALNPTDDGAATARKALTLCAASERGGSAL
ncbi:MAG: tetratricopeptide repeat protein [Caulobacteraceae bacterium]|nr:tetratricopeptide repeat protein [Caulobacteraceae bacterium]